MGRRFQFVAVTDPSGAAPPHSKRARYSHAFRQAHAEKRRKQVEAFTHQQNVSSKTTLSELDSTVSSPLSQGINSNRDPFSCSARPLSSGEYYLLHHYVHVVIPFTIGHCALFEGQGDHSTRLLRDWVGLAITDDALMIAAVLLSTCRYLLRTQTGHAVFEQMALQYKQTCLQTLRQETKSLSPGSVKVPTVAKALALAIDETTMGEHAVARKHLSGVMAIVNSSGGAKAFGLTGLVERIYRRFIVVFDLATPGETAYDVA